jgi:large subunit ribosomal protein L1
MGRITKNKKASLGKSRKREKVTRLMKPAELVKEITYTKFDASVDIDVRLGVDPRKANQMVRGVVSLPHGTGKEVTCFGISYS